MELHRCLRQDASYEVELTLEEFCMRRRQSLHLFFLFLLGGTLCWHQPTHFGARELCHPYCGNVRTVAVKVSSVKVGKKSAMFLKNLKSEAAKASTTTEASFASPAHPSDCLL